MEEKLLLIKRILKHLKPYKFKIIFILGITLLSTGINAILPMANKYLIDDGLINRNYNIALKMVLIILVLSVIEQVNNLLETKYIGYISNMLVYKLSSKSMRKIMNLKMTYLDERNFTEINNDLKMDIGNILRVTEPMYVVNILSIFKVIGGFIGLLSIDYKLSLFVLIMIPIKYVITNYFAKRKKSIQENYMEQARGYSAWYGDAMAGLKEIKLASCNNIIMSQFTKKQRKIIDTDMRLKLFYSTYRISEMILFKILDAILYIIGAIMIFNETLTIGGLTAFIGYSYIVLAPISSFFNIKYDMVTVFLSAKRLFKFFDVECEKAYSGKFRLSKSKVQGCIEFKGVSFSYDSSKYALKDVNISINQGEKVGIVGLNGSGKSTLINILLKMYEPSCGNVYFDEKDIRNIKTSDLRDVISVVSQDIYLFNASIEENVRMFKQTTQENFTQTLKVSGGYDFIRDLVHNLDSKLGVKGNKISGGEKQKIALARALLKQSKVIILDEATSNIDIIHEKLLNKMILNDLKGYTVIVITHKPYILKELDKIIVMDKGMVLSVDSHTELIESNDLYKRIINQSSWNKV